MSCNKIHDTIVRDIVETITYEPSVVKQKSVNESIIRDIIDVGADTIKSDVVMGVLNKGKSFKSISSASSNLVLVFPVLTSTTMGIENASMVCKAIERKCVSMMQMLFSAIQITDSRNALEYISNFHTNLKYDNDISVDQFIDAMDRNFIQKEGYTVEQKAYIQKIKSDLRNMNYFLPESISENSISSFKVGSYDSVKGKYNILYEANKNNFGYKNETIKTNINISKKETSGIEDSRVMADTLDKRASMFKTQILDSDIKKANELIPTSMVVNFTSTNFDEPISTSIVLGIKAKLYPIDSMDIINRLSMSSSSNKGFSSFIRATTKEISFWKDFVFAIDKAKIDALSSSRRGSSSKVWKLLERRALKSKVRRSLGQANDASAITSILITQEEVEYLKKNHNMDIQNPSLMKEILDDYNLMCAVIVDEAMEISKFLFDSDDAFETLTFNALERESGDNSKKIINLMSKIAR